MTAAEILRFLLLAFHPRGRLTSAERRELAELARKLLSSTDSPR